MAVQAVTTRFTDYAHAGRPTRRTFVLAVAGVVISSWVPVVAGVAIRAAAGWIVVIALAAAIWYVTRRFTPGVLVSGFVVSSAFVASGLVSDATHYMPVAETWGALALRILIDLRRAGSVRVTTPKSVLYGVGLYIAWAALSTLTSIDHRVSAEYLAGIFVVCATTLWAIPAVLEDPVDRDNLLVSIGVLGVAVALSVYIVEVAGPLTIFGRPVGDYVRTDLTLGGHATGIFVGRSAGIYLAPFEAGMTMAIAIGLLLGWSASRQGRSVLLARLAIGFMSPALLLTMDRSAWLAAIVAAGALAVFAQLRRVRSLDTIVVGSAFAAVFLVVLVAGLGANAVGNFCSRNCGPGSVVVEVPLRGGTGLTGREYLWSASITAVKHRPLLGYGPGNDVRAIGPYLSVSGQGIEVLTSHSTWLRTAVEMGAPGLAFLLWVILAVAVRFVGDVHLRRSSIEVATFALAAALCGLLPAMTFESFLLGGVTFTSLFLAVALGMVAAPITADQGRKIGQQDG